MLAHLHISRGILLLAHAVHSAGALGGQPFFPFTFFPDDASKETHGFMLAQNLAAVALWCLIPYGRHRGGTFFKVN